MNVLHLIDSLSLGGAQTMLRGIVDYAEQAHNFTVFGLRTKANTLQFTNKNVQHSKSTGKYSLTSLFELFRLAKKLQPEIIHCHLFKANIFGFLCKLFVLPNSKLVIHEHGQILFNQPIYPFVIRLINFKVEKYIAVSETVQQQLIKKSGIKASKIEVFRNFSTIHFPAQQKNKQELFTIGFIGRLSPEKGCAYLLKAAALLNFEYKILIAGNGVLLNHLQNLAIELKISEKLEFLGFVENVESFYSQISVCVVPSLSEASPMVIPEIRNFGVPVIASKIPALEEIITDQETGIFFEPKNSIDLADKIRLLYKNEELAQKIATAGLALAKQNTLTNYMIRLTEFYNRLHSA